MDASTETCNGFHKDLIDTSLEIRKQAAENSEKAEERFKQYYDRNTNVQTFEAGQKVFLINEALTKFADHYKGPCVIKTVIDPIP